MPLVGDLVQQGFEANRREAKGSVVGALDDFADNRREEIAPDVNAQIIEINQAIPEGGISSNKLSIIDVGKSGLSNVGDKGTDIRIWAGATFENRATAPFRVDQDGNLVATSATLSGFVVSSKGFFSGDGSDGAVDGSGNVTITGSDDTLIVKQYSSWAAGTRTLTVTPTGCIVIIKIQGNADFTNWTFNFTGKGKAGGAGGASVSGVGANGNPGVAGLAVTVNTHALQTVTGGSLGTGGTAAQGTGGAGGTVSPKEVPSLSYMQASSGLWAAPGAGGAGGGSGATNLYASGAGGAGGAGGGCLIIQVGGDVTFSSTTANCNGAAGTAGGNGTNGVGSGDGAGGGGGGGGGGGTFICLYNGTLSGSPTISVAGGAGGAAGLAGNDTSGWDGGGGGGGGSSLAATGSNGTDGTAPNGGVGGGGGAGLSLVALNTAFG